MEGEGASAAAGGEGIEEWDVAALERCGRGALLAYFVGCVCVSLYVFGALVSVVRWGLSGVGVGVGVGDIVGVRGSSFSVCERFCGCELGMRSEDNRSGRGDGGVGGGDRLGGVSLSSWSWLPWSSALSGGEIADECFYHEYGNAGDGGQHKNNCEVSSANGPAVAEIDAETGLGIFPSGLVAYIEFTVSAVLNWVLSLPTRLFLAGYAAIVAYFTERPDTFFFDGGSGAGGGGKNLRPDYNAGGGVDHDDAFGGLASSRSFLFDSIWDGLKGCIYFVFGPGGDVILNAHMTVLGLVLAWILAAGFWCCVSFLVRCAVRVICGSAMMLYNRFYSTIPTAASERRRSDDELVPPHLSEDGGRHGGADHFNFGRRRDDELARGGGDHCDGGGGLVGLDEACIWATVGNTTITDWTSPASAAGGVEVGSRCVCFLVRFRNRGFRPAWSGPVRPGRRAGRPG